MAELVNCFFCKKEIVIPSADEYVSLQGLDDLEIFDKYKNVGLLWGYSCKECYYKKIIGVDRPAVPTVHIYDIAEKVISVYAETHKDTYHIDQLALNDIKRLCDRIETNSVLDLKNNTNSIDACIQFERMGPVFVLTVHIDAAIDSSRFDTDAYHTKDSRLEIFVSPRTGSTDLRLLYESPFIPWF